MSPGYSAQMAVQQAMAGPQQQIFPSTQSQAQGQGMRQGMGMGMGMQGTAMEQGGWQYNAQSPYGPPQQAMGWGNGSGQMGYTYAQGP